MQYLNKSNKVEIDGVTYDKENILNLYKLQRELLEKENLILTLPECINMWQGYSNEFDTSWMDFPKDNILDNIKEIIFSEKII